ncbi:MAG: aspartate kinase [Cyclobacteriaceae bacterium]|nr:aspartate kinase [Cyclobacteriaceae bacterium]
MKVFKFGGASVKNAAAIQNVAKIISTHRSEPLLVVVSAIGKTTNALEEVALSGSDDSAVRTKIEEILFAHLAIVADLFPASHQLNKDIRKFKEVIATEIKANHSKDKRYDQVVSLGEVMSSLILAQYLQHTGLNVEWVDARKYICTDSTFREGKVDWALTRSRIVELKEQIKTRILITQGFIGSSPEGDTTTLGREGSDFSAAIFASCLGAESVTIWKDVPGVMSADPKRLPAATTFDELPFREAAEMTYYGASVIHPKTIKPLANLGIPLLVKNFDNILLPGTRIHECKVDRLPPLIVFKENQCLISCHVTDYTFIDESQIGVIFNELSSRNLKVNLIQNSAISFSFCLDFKEEKVMELISELGKHFEVYYNTGLTLITVKNYDSESFEKYRTQKGVILEQSSRSTLQVLVRS